MAEGIPVADGFALDILGVGRFHWSASSEAVRVEPFPEVDRARISDSFYRHVLPLWLNYRGMPVLHASAVATPHGVVALCAPSRTGKSTLAYGLSRRGYPLWADDAVPLQIGSDDVMALPLPHTLRLRRSAARHFRTGARSLPDADSWQHQDLPAPRPLARVLLLERLEEPVDTATVAIDRVAVPTAVSVLAGHSLGFGLRDPVTKKRTLTDCLTLAARVPLDRIRFTSSLDALPSLLDAVEAHLATPSRPAITAPPTGPQ